MQNKLKHLISSIELHFPQSLMQVYEQSCPVTLCIEGGYLHEVCCWLQEDKSAYFDRLSCLTGIDNGTEKNTMELIYTLHSIPNALTILLRVVLNRSHPEISSVSNLWLSATWFEREVYDLYGILFKNHPDLRRILLPNDWEGFPLRKDYQPNASYHDIKIEY